MFLFMACCIVAITFSSYLLSRWHFCEFTFWISLLYIYGSDIHAFYLSCWQFWHALFYCCHTLSLTKYLLQWHSLHVILCFSFLPRDVSIIMTSLWYGWLIDAFHRFIYFLLFYGTLSGSRRRILLCWSYFVTGLSPFDFGGLKF